MNIQHDRYVPRKESERCWRQDGRYGRSDSTTIQGKSHQPPGFLRQDLSGDIMIRRFPHTSDGAARFRLQSLDLQCWQVNGRWRPADRVPPVRGRAANRTATFLLLNRKLACASDFYKSAYWRVFLIFEKIQGESVPFFQSIIYTKHPVPLTEMSKAPGAFFCFSRKEMSYVE